MNNKLRQLILEKAERIGIDLDGDIVYLDGKKYYVHVINQTIQEMQYTTTGKPIGDTEENVINYSEITKEEFISKKSETRTFCAPVNCCECFYNDAYNERCAKHKVRIYKNLNNPKYDPNCYYPCMECLGKDFVGLGEAKINE